MSVTLGVPNILQEPGFLLWAPPGTAHPTSDNTAVTASKFNNVWPVAWKTLGATEDGTEWNYELRVEAVRAAEFFDPIKWATTERSGNFSFTLLDWTLFNLARVLNQDTATITQTGVTTTAAGKLEPGDPAVGTIRSMIGWESADATVRLIGNQTINGGAIRSTFRRAPATAGLACTFNFEVPIGGKPWTAYTAGLTRIGV